MSILTFLNERLTQCNQVSYFVDLVLSVVIFLESVNQPKVGLRVYLKHS